MDWLQALDVELFRLINLRLVNPVFDVVMPFVSGNPLFPLLVLGAATLLVWKGRGRGVLCVLMLALIVPLGDGLVCRTIKHAVARPRPFVVVPEVHRPGRNPDAVAKPPSPMTQAAEAAPIVGGKGDYTSMPSSHAANWFAAAMILFIYYRRSLWFMLPGAMLVSFSRIYNGVHYPSDVVAGAILGAGYAAASAWSLNALWQWAGRNWFPLWWQELPSLLDPCRRPEPTEGEGSRCAAGSPHSGVDQHWLRLGYLWIAALLLARLAYLGSGTIELSEDEAYQWLWSKHLALSYYSKPPLIAYAQFLGTSLWGDTAFGVRFFSPVIGALAGVDHAAFLRARGQCARRLLPAADRHHHPVAVCRRGADDH